LFKRACACEIGSGLALRLPAGDDVSELVAEGEMRPDALLLVTRAWLGRGALDGVGAGSSWRRGAEATVASGQEDGDLLIERALALPGESTMALAVLEAVETGLDLPLD